MKIFLHILFTFIVCILAGTRRAYSHEKGSRTTALAQPFLHNPDQGVDTFKASMEEGNIQGVVNLLQNHIKQWSFIEAQLLEPNVNLGMPEIFIPLKHLTTTLQTLGSIFLMRDELQDAKSCFERACPLMELLPASLDDGFRADKLEAGLVEIYDDHGEGIQTSTLQKKGGFLGEEEPNGNYAANCFSLLRKVYLKIYDSKLKKKGKEAFGIAHSARLHPSDSPSSSVLQEPSSYATGQSVWEEQQLEEDEGDEYEDHLSQPNSAPFRSASVAEVAPEKVDEDGGENVDIEEMIEQLRLPFQHLRSELLFVRQTGKDNEESTRDDSYIDSTEDVRVPFERQNRPNEWEGLRNALFPTPHIATSPVSTSSSLLVDQESHEDEVVPLHPGASGSGNTGSSTSIIATDLEIMLRKFVKEDAKGRQELLRLAAKYYDNLDINFPYMDYSEYAANMDIGMVYLDVMERVVREGFDFIGPELERWQDLGQALIMRSAHPSGTEEEEVKSPGTIGLGIVWELDPITGKKKEYTVELDGSYFDAFTLAERNRLLVLSAFDIAAHLQPTEQFDLSLGFSLGILDNDRSRQREATALAGALDGLSVIDRAQGKSASAKRRRAPASKVDRIMAALYEEQTTPDLGGFSSLRAAVPTLTLEHWTTNIFLFFLIATVLAVAAASYVTSKRKVISRLRSRGAKRSITSYEQLLHAINKCLGQSGDGDEEESIADLMSSVMRSAVSALAAIPVQLWSQLRLSASVGLQTATMTACSSSCSSTNVAQTVTSGEKVDVDWTARLLSLIPISRSSTRNDSKADNPNTTSQSSSDKARNADMVMLAMESCASIDEGVESAASCVSTNLINSIHSLSSDSVMQSSLSCSMSSSTGGTMGSLSFPQPLSPPKPPSSPRSTQQKRNKDRKEQSSRAANAKDSSIVRKSQGGVISGKDRERESTLAAAPSEGATFRPGAASEQANHEWIWDIADVTKGAVEGDDEGWVEAGAKRKVANRLKQAQSSSDKTKGKISVQNVPSSSSSSISVTSGIVSKVAGGSTNKKGSNSASGSSSRNKIPAVHSAEQPVSVLIPPTSSVNASATANTSTPATSGSGSGRAVTLNLEERLLSTARTKVTTGRSQSNGSSSPNRPSYKIAVANNTSGVSSTVTSSASSVSVPSPTTLPTLAASEEDFFALPPGLAVTSTALSSIPEWIGSTSSSNPSFLPPPGLEESSQQSLLYRLGLAALPSSQNCGQPPGLGLPLSSSISGGHGIISTPLLSSMPFLDEIEQEMERDNLLQGILGDLLSPALDNHHDQDASNNNAAKQTTAYSSPPGQIFPFSDLSPLAPVFEPNKGLSYTSQTNNNTEEWVLNNMNL